MIFTYKNAEAIIKDNCPLFKRAVVLPSKQPCVVELCLFVDSRYKTDNFNVELQLQEVWNTHAPLGTYPKIYYWGYDL